MVSDLHRLTRLNGVEAGKTLEIAPVRLRGNDMQALGKIGKPVISVIAMVLAIGGITAMRADQTMESLVYLMLACIVAVLALILLPASEPDQVLRDSLERRRNERARRLLQARLEGGPRRSPDTW